MGRIVYKGDNYNLYPVKYNCLGIVPKGRRQIHALLPKKVKGRQVSGIYMLVFNDFFYIGRSYDIKGRVKAHLSLFNSLLFKPKSTKLYQSKIVEFLKKNKKFDIVEVKVLIECDESRLQEREQYYINRFKNNPYMFNSTFIAIATPRDKQRLRLITDCPSPILP